MAEPEDLYQITPEEPEGAERDLTDEEDERRIRWNADRRKGVGSISKTEAKAALAYVDAYGASLEEALYFYSRWEEGDTTIPSPSQARALVPPGGVGPLAAAPAEGGVPGEGGAAGPTLPDLTADERYEVELIDGLTVGKAKIIKAFGLSGREGMRRGAWEYFRIPTNEEQASYVTLQDIMAESDLTPEDIVAAASLIPDLTEEDLTNMAGWEYTPQDYARLKGSYEDLNLAPWHSLEDVAGFEKQGTTPLQLQQGIQAEARAAEAERRGVSPEWLVYGAEGRLPPTPGAPAPGPGPQAPEGMTERERMAAWGEMPLPERLAFGVPGAEAEAEALGAEREVRAELQETIRSGIEGGPYYGRGRWAVEGLKNVFLPAMQLWATDINRAFGPDVAAQGVAGIQGAFDRLTTEEYAQAQAGKLPRFGGGGTVPVTSVPLPSWWWGDPKDFPAAMAAARKRARGGELTEGEQGLVDEVEWRRRFYEQTHPPEGGGAAPTMPAAAPTTAPTPTRIGVPGVAATAVPSASGYKAPAMPSVAPPIGGARRTRRRRGMPRTPRPPAGFRKMPEMSRA